MQPRIIAAIAVALLGASSSQHDTKNSKDADAKVRKVVARAIDAVGGENALRRVKSATGKCKGAFWLEGDEKGDGKPLVVFVCRFTGEFAFQWPDRSRLKLTLKADGDPGKVTWEAVTRGDHCWRRQTEPQKEGDKIKDITEEPSERKAADLICDWHRYWLPFRPDMLLDPALKVKPVDPTRIGDRPAVGIRVTGPKLVRKADRLHLDTPEGRPDSESAAVTLYYDAERGLVLRRDEQWIFIGSCASLTPAIPFDDDPEVPQTEVHVAHAWLRVAPGQSFFSDFRKVDGVMVPFKFVHNAMEQRHTLMETTIIDLHLSDRTLPEKTFAKP